jgi:hypothetical protein
MKMRDMPGVPASGSLFGPALLRTAVCLRKERTAAANVTMITVC